MDGIWWILVTGAQWNQLPERYGKWNSVYRFHLRWAKKGVFTKVLKQVAEENNEDSFAVMDASYVKVHQDACYFPLSDEHQSFGKTKGGRNTKIHALTNGKVQALNFILTAGNKHEVTVAVDLLEYAEGRIILGDRGYDSDSLRGEIEEAGGVAQIPGKSNRKEEVFYIKEVAKIRHVVENYFCKIKRFRRIATRYDRTSETYLSFLALASLTTWIDN